MEEIIKTDGLSKVYELGVVKVDAVRNVSISVSRGELISIMGPSGSGKSTLMHLLGCLDKPTMGKYYLEGKDVSKLRDQQLAKIRNKKIGFVFQTFNLLPQLTVLENVVLPAVYDGTSELGKVGKKAINLLTSFGLRERLKNHPMQLSGGEMQRVAIARALINDPIIILADEPTGNLDSKTGLEIIKILKSLNEQSGVTEIIVTHDPNITRFTSRTIRTRDGIIESDEINTPPEEVFEEGV